MALLDIGPKTIASTSGGSALTTNTLSNSLHSRSFSVPNSVLNSIGHGVSKSLSQTVSTLQGTGSVRLNPSPFTLGITTSSTAYMQYPVGSVLRTSDEIGKVLKRYVPGVFVNSRMLDDTYEGGFPVIIVGPSTQHVHQVFTGYSGNMDGVPNSYTIRYLGLRTTKVSNNILVQQAQEKLWFHLELILRALKKDILGNLGGTVIRMADAMDISYSEMGSYVTWREDSFVGSIIKISVFEQYRPYGL